MILTLTEFYLTWTGFRRPRLFTDFADPDVSCREGNDDCSSKVFPIPTIETKANVQMLADMYHQILRTCPLSWGSGTFYPMTTIYPLLLVGPMPDYAYASEDTIVDINILPASKQQSC